MPNSPSEAVTSRNASSSESPSTSGVNDSKIPNTRSLASAYAWKRGGTTIACGACLTARDIGIALRTPNGRTS